MVLIRTIHSHIYMTHCFDKMFCPLTNDNITLNKQYKINNITGNTILQNRILRLTQYDLQFTIIQLWQSSGITIILKNIMQTYDHRMICHFGVIKLQSIDINQIYPKRGLDVSNGCHLYPDTFTQYQDLRANFLCCKYVRISFYKFLRKCEGGKHEKRTFLKINTLKHINLIQHYTHNTCFEVIWSPKVSIYYCIESRMLCI